MLPFPGGVLWLSGGAERLRGEAVGFPCYPVPLSSGMFDLCLNEDGAEHVIDDFLAGFGKLCELIELLRQLRGIR